ASEVTQPRTPADSPFEAVELGDSIQIVLANSDLDTKMMCVMIGLGYTRAEVAAHLHMSEGAVNQRLYRLRLHAWSLADQGRIIPPSRAMRPGAQHGSGGRHGTRAWGSSSTGPRVR
ncbi:hypothetical protein AB0K48_16930, partial [Nonomuraea sp. NPDC055795]